MSYLGDFALGSTLDHKFTTVDVSGIPTQLAGTPAISIYADNSTTEITAGITLTVDFDTRTGLNNVRVVATGGNGYAAGVNYQIVITTGTVGGNSVVGYVVGSFSLENRFNSAFTRLGAPAGASVSADIAAIQSDTDNIQTRLPTSLVSGRIDASVGAMAADTITNTALASSAVTEIQTGLSTLDAAGVRSAVGLASANLDIQLDALPTATENADALLKRDMSAVTGEASRSPLNALRFLRNRWYHSGSDILITKEDDTTTAWLAAVSTDPSAEPIIAVDPA